MLVLSRKVDETIHIGDDIVVRVQKIQGDKVSIGVQAPRETRILRGELEFRKEDQEDASAAVRNT